MPTPAEVLKDDRFWGLPEGERSKVLSKLDPNFSKLPQPEQQKVISHRPRTSPNQSSRSGVMSQVGSALAGPIQGAAQTAYNLADTVTGGYYSKLDKAVAQKYPGMAVDKPFEPSAKSGQFTKEMEQVAEYFIPIGGGEVKAAENAPRWIKALVNAGRSALDLGLKTYAQTKDPQKALTAAGIGGALGPLSERAAEGKLGSDLAAFAKRVPLVRRFFTLPPKSQMDLAMDFYKEVHGKPAESATDRVTAMRELREALKTPKPTRPNKLEPPKTSVSAHYEPPKAQPAQPPGRSVSAHYSPQPKAEAPLPKPEAPKMSVSAHYSQPKPNGKLEPPTPAVSLSAEQQKTAKVLADQAIKAPGITVEHLQQIAKSPEAMKHFWSVVARHQGLPGQGPEVLAEATSQAIAALGKARK